MFALRYADDIRVVRLPRICMEELPVAKGQATDSAPQDEAGGLSWREGLPGEGAGPVGVEAG